MNPYTARIRRGLRDLQPAMYRATMPLLDLRMLPLGVGVPPHELPIPAKTDADWHAIAVGKHWGGRDQNAWFHGWAQVPPDWRVALGHTHALTLRLSLGEGRDFGWPEGLLYLNGRLRQGINRHHPDVLLADEDAQAGELDIAVRAWSGMTEREHRLERAELALLDRQVESLYYLLAMGAETVEALAEDDPLTYALAGALEAAYDALDLRRPAYAAFVESAHTALADLHQRLAALREQYVPVRRPVVTAIGHGHLDVAWLWQTHHTREKTARTFSIATALMEHYPEYVFLHTTPQVYAWLKRDYPDLYARVRARVAEGHFEAAGAMWLESDCNLVSGEALVRQILYGQRFLGEEFGRRGDVLWLPDAFGYSAALPQIMLKSGLRTFMTTKLSWSETNRIPADTFRWRGLDGSEVLAHFITTPSLTPTPPLDHTDTYNGVLTVPAVLGVWQRYREKARNQELLLAFGFGDGGAGPNRQQIELARALQHLPGLPEVRFGRADEYFARLHERVWGDPALPIWDGELYLEYHRGTYTTQAWLKRAHRQNEARLLLAELVDAWRYARNPERAPDVREHLDDAWRTLLLHEFHDILPGSSIGEVYADAREAMAALEARLETLIGDGLRAIAPAGGLPKGSWLVFNPSPWPHDALIELSWSAETPRIWGYGDAQTQQPVATQVSRRAGDPKLLIAAPELPGYGYRFLQPVPEFAALDEAPFPAEMAAHASERTLENQHVHIELNEQGEIISFVDRRVAGGRELVPPGAVANELQLFDDRPRDFDAWDIDAGYERKRYPLGAASIAVVEDGPLRATVRVTRRVLESTITQDISLGHAQPRVDIATRIDWHEQHLLLKVAFPLDLRATRATYEVAYGAVERATHRNTSWDQARFEVPAHRWADLSEADYGVSLLNDGRYGHDVRDNVLRLSLLRSPTAPDPTADQGLHEVTYSLFPHLGDWRTGGTVAAAYALNRVAWAVPITGELLGSEHEGIPTIAPERGFCSAEPANVVVEAVKRAEDGDGLIVRLYEAHGARVTAHITVRYPIAEVIETDLLEHPLRADASPAFDEWQASRHASHDAPVLDHLDLQGWTCQLRPFEVRTFRVRCGTGGG
jgi:alpha-mannosidase